MSRMFKMRRVLRREVLAACAMIFTADVVSGILSPTFSLYAKGLGASLALIGALSSASGLTQLCSSMAIGILSDRTGRKRVLTLGMLSFAAATALFAFAPNPYWLLPGRVFVGLAQVATFTMGIAYIGDVVRPEERGIAFGLYTTCMGTGFAVGPLFGTAVAARYGVAGSYLFASAAALTGAVVAVLGLASVAPARDGMRRTFGLDRAAIGALLRNPALLAGSVANLVMSAVFGGAIVNFFPVYAAQLGLSGAAINSMFSVRAFCSAASRLPTGFVTSRLPSRYIMILALMLAMLVTLVMAQTASLPVLTVLLIVEGLSFGMFLTSGQVFVAQNSTPEARGSAVGIYSTAGSLSATLAPLAQGLVANRWGVAAVFRATALAVVAGLIVVGYLDSRIGAKVDPAASAAVATGQHR
jgi:MFS family permease